MSNTFIVSNFNDLYILKFPLYNYIDSVYYLVIRSFEIDDFPKNVKKISIQYCMIEQNLQNLPPTIEEISFYQNVDNIELSFLPVTIKRLSFEYYINQNIIDNLPAHIKELSIYFRPSFFKYSLTFDNLPVGLEKLKFCNHEWVTIKLNLLPAGCTVL